ncbi:hypothetical protein LQF12_10355 [Ruania suaedae]|uniref:hypothetical protein n=1 Tax=Ruania suaedae TaxID=2897774 RepID=UPI001E4E28E5|nr:hypothetical protein [Ruania suaedae]UFU01917.1 hypothetical protein LQF12_10355 [Ruania suaedae]
MESSLDPSEHRRTLEVAEAAPYVGMPPSPWWVPPAFGGWFAAYLGSFAFWRESEILFILAMVVLTGGVGAFLGWYSRRHGALPVPGRGNPPPEIRGEYRRYAVGVLVIVGAVAAVWWWAGLLVACLAAFVLVTAGLSLYQVRYERAAATVRERLA